MYECNFVYVFSTSLWRSNIARTHTSATTIYSASVDIFGFAGQSIAKRSWALKVWQHNNGAKRLIDDWDNILISYIRPCEQQFTLRVSCTASRVDRMFVWDVDNCKRPIKIWAEASYFHQIPLFLLFFDFLITAICQYPPLIYDIAVNRCSIKVDRFTILP